MLQSVTSRLPASGWLRAARCQPVLRLPQRFASLWAKVEKGPEDPILGVTVAFNNDTSPDKINLGVGAYRTDQGKPYVLPSVREAEKRLLASGADHEYAPIAGVPEFRKVSLELAYGSKSAPLQEKRVASIQALSGTGALRLGAEFLNRFVVERRAAGSQGPKVFLPNPTWGNHVPIFKDSGIDVQQYRYYDPSTKGLDLNGMLEDIKKIPDQSIVLLHASAHNPTGVDPSPQQWDAISKACKEKNHVVVFDMAYQGFGSGDPNTDAYAVRRFVSDGHQILLAQSYSKNFGLYGQRVGCLSLVCADPDELARVESQLKILARPIWSNPPIFGARIVSTVLSDSALNKQWHEEVRGMADRIIQMRKSLRDELERLGSKLSWRHITDQIGMFAYSGLSPQQVDRLTNEFHIYMTRNGRISMAGLTSKNIGYLAKAMHAVTKDSQ